jgi:hypothetical protein
LVIHEDFYRKFAAVTPFLQSLKSFRSTTPSQFVSAFDFVLVINSLSQTLKSNRSTLPSLLISPFDFRTHAPGVIVPDDAVGVEVTGVTVGVSADEAKHPRSLQSDRIDVA